MQLTPIRPAALVAGQLAGTLALGLFQAATYITVGLVAGGHIEAGIPGALVLIALATLITLAFGSIGLIAGMRASTPENVQGLFPVIFVFLFMSSMALPRDLIETDWFRTIATYNPVSYMIEGIRSLLITGWDAEALALGFGCAAAILADRADRRVALDQGEDGEDVIAPLLLGRRRARPAAARQLHQQPGAVPAAAADAALLLRRLRRRALGDRPGARASTTRPATPPSSSASSSCRRPPSAASSPASRSPPTSSSASAGGCCWRRPTAPR